MKTQIDNNSVKQLSPIPHQHRSHSVNKIKLNCFLSNSLNTFNLELPQKTSIRTLKRRISEQLNLSPKSTSNTSFSVIYNDKNLTNFNQLKLSDIIISRNNKHNPTLHNDNVLSSLSEIDSMQLRIVPTEMSERSSTSTSYKLKTMLECIEHIDENAHYYCFECKVSFCALCIDKHSQHDFIDKATYAKTSKDIVDDIIRDMNMTIHEKYECELNGGDSDNKGRNEFIKMILNDVKNDNNKQKINNDNENDDDVVKLIKELMNSYNEYLIQFNKEYTATLNMKVDDYKESLKKFKLICLNTCCIAEYAEI